jgi:hypothetical protein
MSKFGTKLLDAAQDALKAARCDHEWEPLPKRWSPLPPRFSRFRCRKCEAVISVPIEE